MIEDEYFSKAQKGEFFERFLKSKEWAVFDEEILERLDRKAFETFKRVDPNNKIEIIQTQMMSKIINQIRREIDNIVEEGRLARLNLETLPEEDV